MRNLKRALSLTLASVMLLGMMVVGSSAAAGYDDVDVNDNVEAIEVLQAVQVMVGDDRGFGPDRPVTRNEMAVVMGKLLNLDYNYYSEACPFTDVADWAKGWVGAAAANGIVSGRGNGIYDGEATVTAVEAASMMMRALGYFKYQNDYADGFQVATVRQGTKIGIFNMVGTDATSAMTRNQVAQMALNALQSGMVEPDGNTINLTTPDGSVFTGKVNYVYVTSAKDFAHAISWTQATSAGSTNTGYIVELGEQLYDGKLKLEDGKLDDFGRPSRYWEYDGKPIGTYMKKEIIKQEWTDKVTGKMLYDLLGSDTIKNYEFEITIDGVNVEEEKTVMTTNASAYFNATNMTKTWKEGVGRTGKGVLTQVFVDPDWTATRGKVWISLINTYLAKATGDYNEKKDEIKLDVYGLVEDSDVCHKYYSASKYAAETKGKQYKPLLAAGEDFAKVIDMKKDDIVLVTVADGEIKSVADPQVLAAVELSAFSKDNYVVTDQKYEYNTTIDYDPKTLEDYTGTADASGTQQLKDTTYNLFLDPYGYLIGVEVVEAAKNYIFLTGIDKGNSNLNAKTSEAGGILLDGTFLEFKMNMKDSRKADGTSEFATGDALYNTWCTYTVDKDGTYTLREVGDYNAVFTAKTAKAGQFHDLVSNNKTIDTKRVALIGGGTDGGATNPKYVYGNDNSIYLLAELKEVAARNKIEATRPVPGVGAQDITGNGVDEDEPVVVISGVASMGTGIDNIKIKTYGTVGEILSNAKTPDSTAKAYPGWIYTLFDNDGYVIAAVVVGEDDGASKNLVYVNSSKPKQESYSSADDEWTWTREVIADGVSKELTYKGSGLNKIGVTNMTENTWYEVTYKADGTVKDVALAYFSESGKNIGGVASVSGNKLHIDTNGSDTGKDFTDNIKFVENMNVNGKDNYLYEEVWGAGKDATGDATSSAPANSHTSNKGAMAEDNRPTLIGSTLWVDQANKEGFYVSKDVKSVLIQKNNGESSTEYGEGTSDLENMLRSLNYSDETDTSKNGVGIESYLFKISAIMKDGRATVVIIHDWNEGKLEPGTVNPKDDEDGDIDVYVRFQTSLTDDNTMVTTNELTYKATPASNGRLTLSKAKADELLPAGYEYDGMSFPQNLTVADGTSYAIARVKVKEATRTLKLPTGWSYATTAVGKFPAVSTYEFQAGDTAGKTVRVGSTVTITMAAGKTFYAKVPDALASTDTFLKSDATGTADEYSFEVTAAMTNDNLNLSSIESTKYYKVKMADFAPADKAGVTFAATGEAEKYMTATDTFKVTVTSADGGTATGAVTAAVTADGSVTTDVATEQVTAAGTVAAKFSKEITVTPDFTSANKADITLTLALNA